MSDEVTPGEMKKYGALAQVRASLDKLYPDGWDDEQLREHIILLKRRKAEAGQAKAAKARQGEIETSPSLSFEQRLREYELAYENLTPNDRAGFRTLVAFDMELDDIRTKLRNANADARSKLNSTAADISRERRQLETALGIGRATRKQETNAQDEVNRLRDGAQDFVEKHGAKITCTHCVSKFDMGWVLFHFRDEVHWTFRFNCPKCKTPNVIRGEKDEEVVEAEWAQ